MIAHQIKQANENLPGKNGSFFNDDPPPAHRGGSVPCFSRWSRRYSSVGRFWRHEPGRRLQALVRPACSSLAWWRRVAAPPLIAQNLLECNSRRKKLGARRNSLVLRPVLSAGLMGESETTSRAVVTSGGVSGGEGSWSGHHAHPLGAGSASALAKSLNGLRPQTAKATPHPAVPPIETTPVACTA